MNPFGAKRYTLIEPHRPVQTHIYIYMYMHMYISNICTVSEAHAHDMARAELLETNKFKAALLAAGVQLQTCAHNFLWVTQASIFLSLMHDQHLQCAVCPGEVRNQSVYGLPNTEDCAIRIVEGRDA